MWTEPAALTCHVGAGEEETNAANLARLRRPDPIAGYCLHLFGVLEVIGSPSRTLGHPGLLLPSSVIFLRTYWIIDSERERVHVHMFLGRMRGRGGQLPNGANKSHNKSREIPVCNHHRNKRRTVQAQIAVISG